MKTDPRIEFKSQTGSASHCTADIYHMVEEYDTYVFKYEEFDANQIIDMINSETPDLAVKIEDVPYEKNTEMQLVLPTPEYVQWLEEKVKELS